MGRIFSFMLFLAAVLGVGISAADASAVRPAVDLDDEQLECLALTVYWEARGLSKPEQDAVAFVAINRAADDAFPNTICGVVKQGGTERYRCQFHWWCDGRNDEPQDMTAWRLAKSRARAALLGSISDPTYGATYFHNATVKPTWRKTFERTARLGPHIFYR